MNTLKSAAVVVVLLVVLYGVYVALNKPDFFSVPAPVNSDVAPPVVEFGPANPGPAHTVIPSSVPGIDGQYNPASTSRNVTGGSFQPDGAATLPPPTSVPGAPPLDPTAGSGDLQRSNFESPVGRASSAPPLESPASPAATAAPAGTPALTAYSLKRDWQEAEQAVADGKFKAALAKLTPYYGNPDLAPQDRAQLIAWLDALAAKVIYSREHLLAGPHRVSKGETLYELGKQYSVPWKLLQSVNGLAGKDPLILVQGTELKVVPGPFRADVNLTTGELTVFLNDLYAGRFPFTVGEYQPPPRTYQVVDKKNEYAYYTLDGRIIPNNDPNNPYGGFWLSLGQDYSIHGSPTSASATSTSATVKPLGCISLSPQDARDIYGILSISSEVVVRR